jgi:hypothetical protein
VPSSEFSIDYAAARGSNTGDEFHELWAARQALRMLDAAGQLSGITVEGVRADDIGSVWDGVDCCLFVGEPTAANADRIQVQQLKYSAASPHVSWTVSRMCSGKDGVKSSLIRKLANVFTELVSMRPGKPLDTLTIALVSNQPVDAETIALIAEARMGVDAGFGSSWRKGKPPLHRLVYASGLTPAKFREFASVLDLQTSTGSRFSIENGILTAIAQWTDVELVECSSRIRTFIRKRMLPEAAGEIICPEHVLTHIAGVSDGSSLFPCISRIAEVDASVPRSIARTILGRMTSGAQHLCMHGAGGVGKTTALQQVRAMLPPGSEMIVFDCYGDGSFLDASSLRHRAQDAFVQLSNDIANCLRLPLLVTSRSSADHPRLFRKRLEVAAAVMATARPGSLLAIAIDAADNSVIAAETRVPSETSFIHDLFTLNALPENVRVIVSARTGRLDNLRLPRHFEKMELLGFEQAETATNVRRHWPAPDEWIADFHHLSRGLPRVQSYAFEGNADQPSAAIESLRPNGKSLEQVFRQQFDFALQKSGQAHELTDFCAALVTLQRPIPTIHLAEVLGFVPTTVTDTRREKARPRRAVRGETHLRSRRIRPRCPVVRGLQV